MFCEDWLQLIIQIKAFCVTESVPLTVALYVILDFTRGVIIVKESHPLSPDTYPFFCFKEEKLPVTE